MLILGNRNGVIARLMSPGWVATQHWGLLSSHFPIPASCCLHPHLLSLVTIASRMWKKGPWTASLEAWALLLSHCVIFKYSLALSGCQSALL